MNITTQLSDGNKLTGCLTFTLIEYELAVKVSYLSFKILARGYRIICK